jgi:hypothetical protein
VVDPESFWDRRWVSHTLAKEKTSVIDDQNTTKAPRIPSADLHAALRSSTSTAVIVIGGAGSSYIRIQIVPRELIGINLLDFLGTWVVGGLGLGGLSPGGLGLRGLCGLDLSVGLGPSPPSVHIALCLLCFLVFFFFFTSINIFCFQHNRSAGSQSYSNMRRTLGACFTGKLFQG